MGMYTEIVVKIAVKKSAITEQEFNVLDYLFNPTSHFDYEELPEKLNHPFFECDRWSSIGHSSSFYHHPNTIMDWYIAPFDKDRDTVYIFSRSDLKNYDEEIELFFDWLKTLKLYTSKGEFIGYSLYEEDSEPTTYTY